MSRRPMFWVALAGLAGLPLLMLWSLLMRQGETTPAEVLSSDSNTLQLRGIDTWEYREDGSPRYRLQAATAIYDATHSVGSFSDVYLFVYDDEVSAPSWSITAGEGSLIRQRTLPLFAPLSETRIDVALKRQVEVEKTQADGTVLLLSTPELNYSTSAGTISSDAGITQLIEPAGAAVITLTADSFSYDQAESLLMYSGDVELVRTQLDLNADTLRVELDGQRISDFAAAGSPASFFYRADEDASPTTGSAETIDYDPQSQLLLLAGNATLKQPRGTLTSDRIQYNLRTRTVTASAAAATDN